MKKRSPVKIILRVILIAMLLAALFFAVVLYGNPISKLLAERGAERHLKAHYADTDYAIEQIGYSPKDGCYYAELRAPSSVDGDFALCFDGLGRFVGDTYDERVAGGSNTERRVRREYQRLVSTLFDDPDFPYALEAGSGHLAVEYDRAHNIRAIGGQPVVVDGDYDIYAMGKTHGALTIRVADDTVTPARMAEILRDVKTRLDDADIPYCKISTFALLHPRDPETNRRPEGALQIEDLLYTDLEDADLTGYVQEKLDAQVYKVYYNR